MPEGIATLALDASLQQARPFAAAQRAGLGAPGGDSTALAARLVTLADSGRLPEVCAVGGS